VIEMLIIFILIGLVVAVIVGVSITTSTRTSPLAEIARTQARHSFEAQLFEHRSRVRADRAERAAKSAMARQRGDAP
jgi:hypothetical protein